MTKLINVLNADQQRNLGNIRAAAERIWARPLHRYYTDHSVAHSEKIIALLDGLTAGMMDTGKRLCPDEVFTLLAAAYLHDIGMQDERFADGDIETIRKQHHEQTAEMIYAVFENPAHAFHIPLDDDPGLIEAIALVARGHRRVDLAGAEYDSFAHGNETLRPRLLAALLRFGDELDIDHRRVDLEQMKLLNLPTDSQLHWWKCHYVSGVSIEDEYIRVSYRFPRARPDYETLIIPLVEDEIRAKHADLQEIFRASAVKLAVGRSKVRLMRLVKPLPAEVEALAKILLTGDGRAAGQNTATSSDDKIVWNTEAIRQLLNAAFNDEELTQFCYDHFLTVYHDFSVGMAKGIKVQRLLDYCGRHTQMEQLVELVKERYPGQYARFEGQLQGM